MAWEVYENQFGQQVYVPQDQPYVATDNQPSYGRYAGPDAGWQPASTSGFRGYNEPIYIGGPRSEKYGQDPGQYGGRDFWHNRPSSSPGSPGGGAVGRGGGSGGPGRYQSDPPFGEGDPLVSTEPVSPAQVIGDAVSIQGPVYTPPTLQETAPVPGETPSAPGGSKGTQYRNFQQFADENGRYNWYAENVGADTARRQAWDDKEAREQRDWQGSEAARRNAWDQSEQAKQLLWKQGEDIKQANWQVTEDVRRRAWDNRQLEMRGAFANEERQRQNDWDYDQALKEAQYYERAGPEARWLRQNQPYKREVYTPRTYQPTETFAPGVYTGRGVYTGGGTFQQGVYTGKDPYTGKPEVENLNVQGEAGGNQYGKKRPWEYAGAPPRDYFEEQERTRANRSPFARAGMTGL